MLDKWIGYYENIVSNDLCDDVFKYPWSWSPSKYENDSGVIKNSEERVKMDEVWVEELNRPYPILKKSVLKVINNYAEEHKNFSCIHHTNFRINRYGVGGFMSPHVDNIHHSHGQQYGYPQCSVILFLNDDYKGGHFIVADKEYVTKKGSAIIFPSNFMFPHEVKKVTDGERWSIVTWIM
jgi:hypothetical protein|tara:strand:+ start:300 stop:839 length:540 start_codon:yes stop_codon:yes gene_type:complete